MNTELLIPLSNFRRNPAAGRDRPAEVFLCKAGLALGTSFDCLPDSVVYLVLSLTC